MSVDVPAQSPASSADPLVAALPASLAGSRVLVIGGSSGWGGVAARILGRLGAAVSVASRSGALPPGATDGDGSDRLVGRAVDFRDGDQLEVLAEQVGPLDHVLVTAATITGGPVTATPFAAVQNTIVGWVQGTYETARVLGPRIVTGGSLTFTSGISTLRPQPGSGAPAAAGAGIEALARVLAIELAPVRVNVVRPGAIDSSLLRRLVTGGAGVADDATIAAVGAGLPAGRVAREEEVAAAAVALMANPYLSGQVLGVDAAAALA